jgi:mannose-1-phosphate guanylyltransferase
MVTIGGRPLIEYWLNILMLSNVSNVIINTHYLPSTVRDYVDKSPWRKFITLVHEEELLGTGGTILRNSKLLAGGPFLVAHADNLTRFSLHDFMRCHVNRPAKTEITMMLFKSDNPSECGVVEIDSKGIVTGFYEKVPNPPGNLANGAVYIFEESMLGYLNNLKKDKIDLSNEVLPNFINRINTYENKYYHRDIGSIKSLEIARKDFFCNLLQVT